MAVTRNNHYLPGVYLKQFANADGVTWMYRLLVSRPEVKLWKPSNISAVGYQRDLYTRIAIGTETDEFENWLNKEFETPAESVLSKVRDDEELDPGDWSVLVRFLACQSVRTPAFFLKMLPIWKQMLPAVMNETLAEVRAKLLWAKITGEMPVDDGPNEPRLNNVTFRVRREDVPEEKSVRLWTEVVVGRGMWLGTMELLLTCSIRHLEKHHWGIFHGASGADFFTSDDPVVKLNYRGLSNYDFNAGWGNQGAEIFMPLTPRHLMYTKIGALCPRRGLMLSESETRHFRKMIAEHAHRSIFAVAADPEIQNLRPRKVDSLQVQHERAQWQHWHEEQTRAEAALEAK